MLLNLLRLESVNWRRVAAIGGAGALVVVVLYLYAQGVSLAQERAITDRYVSAYQNPRVITKTRTVRVEGAVRIVTRVVEVPGRKETTTTEDRAPVMVVDSAELLREPVLPPPPSRSAGGWLTGMSMQPFHRNDRSGWTAWGGYSIGGKLDLCAGVTGGGRATAQALWRW
jgi:hypothetical protein